VPAPPQVALLAIGRATERHCAKVVRLIRQSETLASPFTRLLKQMRPGDAGIVLIIESDTRYAYMHRLAHIRQQAAIERHARQQGQVSLGNAKRQVGAIRLPPCSEHLTIDGNRTGNRTTIMHGTQEPVPRRRVVHMHAPRAIHIAVPEAFMIFRELYGLLQILHVGHVQLFIQRFNALSGVFAPTAA
jgi:hypothetical protein